MRRQEKQMTDAAARAVLASADYGILSLVGHDGIPYGVPVNFVYAAERIYIHSASEGQKLQALARNPQVCFTVVLDAQVRPERLDTLYQSAIAQGQATLVEGEEKRRALQLLLDKYAPENPEGVQSIETYWDRTAVIRIAVQTLTGKHSK